MKHLGTPRVPGWVQGQHYQGVLPHWDAISVPFDSWNPRPSLLVAWCLIIYFEGQGSLKPLLMVFLKRLSLIMLLPWPEGQAYVFPQIVRGGSPCAFLLQLLPIPDSLPISPDDGQHADIYKLRIRVRGNLEWAPPRPQIIFNVHPAPT